MYTDAWLDAVMPMHGLCISVWFVVFLLTLVAGTFILYLANVSGDVGGVLFCVVIAVSVVVGIIVALKVEDRMRYKRINESQWMISRYETLMKMDADARAIVDEDTAKVKAEKDNKKKRRMIK